MISINKLLLKGEENDIFWEINQQESNLIVNITAHRPEKPFFHWGVEKKDSDVWHIPPRAIWPSKTRDMHDGQAVQTPLTKNGNNQFSVTITMPQNMEFPEFISCCISHIISNGTTIIIRIILFILNLAPRFQTILARTIRSLEKF